MTVIQNLIKHLGKDSVRPLLAGLASGVYPMAFYYSKNFNFVNSLSHLFFFIAFFIVLPIAVNYLFYFFYEKKHLQSYKNFVLPVLNALAFFSLAIVAIDSKIGNKKFAVALVIAFTIGFACWYLQRIKLFSKVMLIQYLLCLVVAFPLGKTLWNYFTSSDNWLQQPDHIEQIVLQERPNIYLIQPDGYVNPSELGRGYYQFDNSEFESWLKHEGFTVYRDFRSNYPSTMTSNSSMFAMRHHYFRQIDARNTIMNLNPVVKILKNNGYHTHFLAEVPYLLSNRPRVSFDYSNFQRSEIPYLGRGFGVKKDILEDLKPLIRKDNQPKFYFFEKLLPGHIRVYKEGTGTAEAERENYLNDLQAANRWLRQLVTFIVENDPDGLIIIVADHGGFVGWEYSLQAGSKTDDTDLVISIYSTMLAIKWTAQPPSIDKYLKSNVNLFRVLFSHLSQDASLLENLQDNSSYNNFMSGEHQGIFKVLNDSGNMVLERVE